jgi:DNA-binding MarR family transcriptional regulator
MACGDAPMDDLDPVALGEAQHIMALVRGLRRGLLGVARAEIVRSGLTGGQLNVVSLLGTRGPLTLTELSRELEIGHSTVSGIVDRLQAKGIVQRRPDPADRRYTRISLTEEVNRRAQALLPRGPGSRLVHALAAAAPEERQTMRDGLTLLQRYLTATRGESDAGPPASQRQ